MRIVVLGDPFSPSAALAVGMDRLTGEHEVGYFDVTEEPDWRPSSSSEAGLREYLGSPSQIIAALDRFPSPDVLVVQGAPVSDTVLDSAPSIRLIGCVRGGPVNIDLSAATARGVPVVTTPGKNADAVAELTIGFMIMLARRLPAVVRHVEAGGDFGHDNYEGRHWFGHDLAGRTLGLIGFGQIGRRVAVRARAFGMMVSVYDPFVAPAVVVAEGADPVDLGTLLARSHFVSIHARSTGHNAAIIGSHEIAAMRPGTHIINTARDSLVDEAALIEGLASGQLGGVALDVASPSPSVGRHPLLAFPNVIITAHIGGATAETLHHGTEMIVAEIERLASGQPLLNLANRDELAARPAGSATG